jgi:glycosyltransferase involved in cell wall biosynthesis
MSGVGVSIVMPCLNERQALGHCIAVAAQALRILAERHGLSGEIIIADNGSTDGSQELAEQLGARVVAVPRRGYGAALSGGFSAAQGRYLVMGDADGSYDFLDAVPMVEALMNGADLCMGSRFRGGIKPGAMPWKNRYVGNPILTGILNLLFRAGVDDAHCGLRALTKRCFERLRLGGTGMEFASEMIIKAALLGERIAEVPATLSPDLRGRPPHLRPWRDGWRHLRYLLMLSPFWLFAVPAAFGIVLSMGVLLAGATVWLSGFGDSTIFGNYWIILAGSTMALSHVAGILAITGQFYGIREGYRKPPASILLLARSLSLEAMLIAGFAVTAAGVGVLVGVVVYWSAQNFGPIGNVLPAVLGTTLVMIGVQNVLGGFLLAIVSGNDATFLQELADQRRLATVASRSLPALESGLDSTR